jgi:hypothetical protein
MRTHRPSWAAAKAGSLWQWQKAKPRGRTTSFIDLASESRKVRASILCFVVTSACLSYQETSVLSTIFHARLFMRGVRPVARY